MSNKTTSTGELPCNFFYIFSSQVSRDRFNQFSSDKLHWDVLHIKDARSGEIDPVQEQLTGRVREVGNYAIWSLSSCKPGFGVDQLRDDITETYWQSDGQLPHLVNIQFKRKTTIRDICIYTDYKLDESYTPNR